MNRRYLKLVAVVTLVAVVMSCTASQLAPTDAQLTSDIPGFWKGLWHGFIAPITFFVSLFSDHVRVYAWPNTGRLYDLGFMLGISGFSGGVFAGSRNRPQPQRREP